MPIFSELFSRAIGGITNKQNMPAAYLQTKDATALEALRTDGIVISSVKYEAGKSGVDASTEALEIIDHAHHEIHAGKHFTAPDYQLVSTATFKWLLVVPAGSEYAHMIFNVECNGELLVKVTEGADRAGGDAVAIVNRKRIGTPNVSLLTLTSTPAGGTTDGATTLIHKRVGATGVAGKTIAAGGARPSNEFNLKPSTSYIISATTFAASYVSLELDWYEHTDLN